MFLMFVFFQILGYFDIIRRDSLISSFNFLLYKIRFVPVIPVFKNQFSVALGFDSPGYLSNHSSISLSACSLESTFPFLY